MGKAAQEDSGASGTSWSEQEQHKDYLEGGPKLTHPTPDSSGALRNSME
jgi:hypothetical protein